MLEGSSTNWQKVLLSSHTLSKLIFAFVSDQCFSYSILILSLSSVKALHRAKMWIMSSFSFCSQDLQSGEPPECFALISYVKLIDWFIDLLKEPLSCYKTFLQVFYIKLFCIVYCKHSRLIVNNSESIHKLCYIFIDPLPQSCFKCIDLLNTSYRSRQGIPQWWSFKAEAVGRQQKIWTI